jgi:hypothetical protein
VKEFSSWIPAFNLFAFGGLLYIVSGNYNSGNSSNNGGLISKAKRVEKMGLACWFQTWQFKKFCE